MRIRELKSTEDDDQVHEVTLSPVTTPAIEAVESGLYLTLMAPMDTEGMALLMITMVFEVDDVASMELVTKTERMKDESDRLTTLNNLADTCCCADIELVKPGQGSPYVGEISLHTQE